MVILIFYLQCSSIQKCLGGGGAADKCVIFTDWLMAITWPPTFSQMTDGHSPDCWHLSRGHSSCANGPLGHHHRCSPAHDLHLGPLFWLNFTISYLPLLVHLFPDWMFRCYHGHAVELTVMLSVSVTLYMLSLKFSGIVKVGQFFKGKGIKLLEVEIYKICIWIYTFINLGLALAKMGIPRVECNNIQKEGEGRWGEGWIFVMHISLFP